ncbi:MAG TPA: hypothetical protein PLT49_01420, partial [Ferruginibacter sp.]|nr:hypothetical protein [Ferruginibacter sp.]
FVSTLSNDPQTANTFIFKSPNRQITKSTNQHIFASRFHISPLQPYLCAKIWELYVAKGAKIITDTGF